MMSLLDRLLSDESGVTAIEYAIMAGALAAGVTVVVGTAGDATSLIGRLQTRFQEILGPADPVN